jgi:type II secretory ATPase GspE/PulE/Tfp pilus assembly ATPase PilB-like protein
MRWESMRKVAVAAGVCVLAAHATCAADLVFKNGQTLRGVKIVSRNADSISVQVNVGVIRYPLSALETIDGQPAMMADAAVQPAPAQPASQQSSAAPVTVPATMPANVSAPAAAPAPVKTAAAPSGPDRWNFEFLLGGLLVFAALWMRSVQAVQKDLQKRRLDPGIWPLLALIVPILGAAIYFVVGRKGGERAQTKPKAAAPRADAPAASGTGLKFPGVAPVPTFDPSVHMARKGHARRGLVFLDAERNAVETHGNGEEASGLDNASEMLEEALREKASDIHVEPASDVYRVRFRLDGIMHERTSYGPSDGVRLVTAIKSLAEIDISEKRKAQDGKFRVSCEGREVDFRVATANSIYGEKVVIRVLDHRGGVFDLGSLGMSAEMVAQLREVINSRNGMILATGPTGSGKTSTLYAALRQLDGTRLNIMTIEDPVEYELPGATQIAVNPKAGVTYEGGLRSILRQDPDVILVGEMRDAEATSIALRAALTGHLVFSSLHTKDAIGTITRLQDLGIERYQVASALLVVIAQRLVRVLCPDCRQPYAAEGPELESVGLSFEPGSTIYAPQGCEACHGTGFRGRTGIFEMLVLDEEFRRAFGEGVDEDGLLALAIGRGFRNYRFDGAEKVLMGITTVEEVLRAS